MNMYDLMPYLAPEITGREDLKSFRFTSDMVAQKKVASGTKFIPYSKEFAQKQVQYAKATITDIARSGKTTLKNIGNELGNKEIPKRISVEQVSLAGGPTLRQVMMEKQTSRSRCRHYSRRMV